MNPRHFRAAQLALLLASAGVAPTWGSAQDQRRGVPRGDYRNVDYDYEVRLPAGTSYEMSAAPNPNHGFLIPLASGDTVWMNASYTDSATLRGAAAAERGYRPNCRETHRSNATLGGLHALELTFSCVPQSGGAKRTERVLMALRSPQRRGTIQYVVGVRTSVVGSSKASGTFRAVARGFRTIAAR